MTDDNRVSRRERVIRELTDTERTYVGHLGTVVKSYIRPLREGEVSDVTSDHVSAIFSNMETICQLNTRFLIELTRGGSSGEGNIGAVFLNFAHYFKMYSDFASNFCRANALVRQLRDRSSSFNSFCSKAEKSTQCTLESMLIRPIQRIPRYKLLLGELLQNSSNPQSELKSLQQAVKLVDEVATHINEEIRAQEHRERIVALEKRFIGNPHFTAPGRLFIKSGGLKKETKNGEASLEFFLFNDLLAFASRHRRSFSRAKEAKKYKVQGRFPINLSFSLQSHSNHHDFGFAIKSDDIVLKVRCKTGADKQAWIHSISSCILQFRSRSIQNDQFRTSLAYTSLSQNGQHHRSNTTDAAIPVRKTFFEPISQNTLQPMHQNTPQPVAPIPTHNLPVTKISDFLNAPDPATLPRPRKNDSTTPAPSQVAGPTPSFQFSQPPPLQGERAVSEVSVAIPTLNKHELSDVKPVPKLTVVTTTDSKLKHLITDDFDPFSEAAAVPAPVKHKRGYSNRLTLPRNSLALANLASLAQRNVTPEKSLTVSGNSPPSHKNIESSPFHVSDLDPFAPSHPESNHKRSVSTPVLPIFRSPSKPQAASVAVSQPPSIVPDPPQYQPVPPPVPPSPPQPPNFTGHKHRSLSHVTPISPPPHQVPLHPPQWQATSDDLLLKPMFENSLRLGGSLENNKHSSSQFTSDEQKRWVYNQEQEDDEYYTTDSSSSGSDFTRSESLTDGDSGPDLPDTPKPQHLQNTSNFHPDFMRSSSQSHPDLLRTSSQSILNVEATMAAFPTGQRFVYHDSPSNSASDDNSDNSSEANSDRSFSQSNGQTRVIFGKQSRDVSPSRSRSSKLLQYAFNRAMTPSHSRNGLPRESIVSDSSPNLSRRNSESRQSSTVFNFGGDSDSSDHSPTRIMNFDYEPNSSSVGRTQGLSLGVPGAVSIHGGSAGENRRVYRLERPKPTNSSALIK
mmetsp:Transcript_38185/g.75148  ORF Transcript_38185/g.75148 Transcript_38185/m.75148 type:complete len:959 (-) Transcript_38185:22-2898(-)